MMAHAFHFAMVVSTAAASAAEPLERIESNGSISPAKESPVAQLDYFMFIIQEMEGDSGRYFPLAHIYRIVSKTFLSKMMYLPKKKKKQRSYHFISIFKETCPEYCNIFYTSNVPLLCIIDRMVFLANYNEQ